MNAKKPKKLILSKETVRTLDSEELQGVAGGYLVMNYAPTPPINLRFFEGPITYFGDARLRADIGFTTT